MVHLIIQSNHKHTFSTTHDGISLKLIKKTVEGPPGGQIHPLNFDKIDLKHWYYADNFTNWTIGSCKVTIQIHLWQSMIVFIQNYLQTKMVIALYMGIPGSTTQFLTKNDPKYWYYANNFTIPTIWSCKVTTKIHSGHSMMVFL